MANEIEIPPFSILSVINRSNVDRSERAGLVFSPALQGCFNLEGKKKREKEKKWDKMERKNGTEKRRSRERRGAPFSDIFVASDAVREFSRDPPELTGKPLFLVLPWLTVKIQTWT